MKEEVESECWLHHMLRAKQNVTGLRCKEQCHVKVGPHGASCGSGALALISARPCVLPMKKFERHMHASSEDCEKIGWLRKR